MAATEDILNAFFMSYMPSPGITGLREARLERMAALLGALGNPEDSFKKIHIAGSKGKGSTSTMLSVLLEQSGEKCGLYLSPHVYDIRERFTLAGKFFDDKLYLDSLLQLKKGIAGLQFTPSTFELYTAYAYILFKNASCTYAVIETGLGGRLDATNTIKSVFQVLMPIELEHQDLLGGTIREIAAEKSKIIKRGTRCYIAEMLDEAKDVFLREADMMGCKAVLFEHEISGFFHSEEKTCSMTSFSIDGENFVLHTRLRGKTMAKNLALSILIAKREGFLTEKGISELEKLEIPGRFELRSYHGRSVVFEVAHTKRSMENAVETFKAVFPHEDTLCLFSAVEGKDHESMLKMIIDNFNTVVITKAGDFKKSDPKKLFELANSISKGKTKIMLEEDERKAFSLALDESSHIMVAGSFYLVGNFKREDCLC